jgi:hypothetical protein
MVKTLLCAVVVGCIACACASRQEGITQTGLPVVAPDKTDKPITSDDQAMARALLFTKQRQLDWGEPTGHYRTVSKWYAVQFADGPHKRKRRVLVNPANGHTELPMRR